jgi:hypothetical protein
MKRISHVYDLEQVYCIFLFLGAASLFGTLVSQINEIVAAQQVVSKELDLILDAYLSIHPRQDTAPCQYVFHVASLALTECIQYQTWLNVVMLFENLP